MANIHREGVTLLSESEAASGDQRHLNIIFVHGLRGHPRGTWSHIQSTSTAGRIEDTDTRTDNHKNIKTFFGLRKSKKETDDKWQTSTPPPSDIFWPEEYLASDLPQARIWTYGYNADVIGGLFHANNQNSVSQHGRDFAVRLERDIDNEDPIVFVAHSLGGIVTKYALHRSETICKRTKLVVFLGTPHRGSTYAGWGVIASNLASLALQDSNKRLVQTLEVNGEVLDNIHEEFKTILSKCAIKVHSFQEAKGISGMKGLDSKVVDNFSSKLDLAKEQETVETIDANHMEMARCSSRDDACYRQICGVLKQFIRTRLSSRETNSADSKDRSLQTQSSPKPSSMVLELGQLDTLNSFNDLGLVLEKQGKYEEAEAMHRRALEGKGKMLGVEHIKTLTSVSNLGSVLLRQGKYEEAEAMHQRALEGFEKVLGVEHPNTLASVGNLGSTLLRQGKYKEAEAMYQRDLQGSEKVLGVEHLDTLTSVSNLGSVLQRQGRYEEAEAMHQRALEGFEKVLGVEHSHTLTTMARLATIFWSQKQWKKAERLEMRVMETRQRVLGHKHPDTVMAIHSLAFTLKSQARNTEAISLMEICFRLRERVLGCHHPDTQSSLETLNEWQMEKVEIGF